MDIPREVWIAGGVLLLVLVAAYGFLVLRSRRIKLTRAESPDQKPEWIRTTPPPETIAATQANNGEFALYKYDPDEQIAAPFAEQIEDILRARLNADPALAATDVDLGTAPDGKLEIWIDGERYTDVGRIPDERMRQAILQAIESWKQT